MNQKFIVIDGKTYRSADEMPPDVRQKYEQAMSTLGDANNNHVPDAFENMNFFADKDKNGLPDVLDSIATGNTVINSMKIIIDGKEFNNIEDLPPEARARYEEAMGKLDANRNGIPDFVEGLINATNQTANISNSFGSETTRAASQQAGSLVDPVPSAMASSDLPISPTLELDKSSSWPLVLTGLVVLLLCIAGAAGVWYFFLR